MFFFFFLKINLIYKFIKKFEKLEENSPIFVLMGVRVVFLPKCPLVLFLLKYKGVGIFLN